MTKVFIDGREGTTSYSQTIFLNGKEAVSDTCGYFDICFCEKTGKLYHRNSSGSLMEYNGWTSREVCEYVTDCAVLGNGSVLITAWDVDSEDYQKQLWLWNGTQMILLDEGNVILAP